MIGRIWNSAFVKAHFWQSAGNYFGMAGALGISLVLSRLIPVSEFGRFAFVSSTVALSMVPASFSLGAVLVSDGGKTEGLDREILSLCLPISFLKLLCLLPVAGFFLWKDGMPTAMLALLCALPEIFKEYLTVPKAFVEGQQKFHFNTANAVAGTFVSGGASVLTAWLGWGAFALAISSLSSWALGTCLYLWAARLVPVLAFRFSTLRRHIRAAMGLWFNGLTEVAMNRVDKLFVGHFYGDIALGSYNRAFNYAPLSIMLLNSFLTNPTVSLLSRQEDKMGRRKVLAKTAGIVLFGATINFLVFFLFSESLVPFLFGAEWAIAVPYFRAFSSYSIVIGTMYLSIAALLAFRKYRLLAFARGGCLLLFLALLFTVGTGASGVTVAVLLQIALAIQTAILWIAVRKDFFG